MLEKRLRHLLNLMMVLSLFGLAACGGGESEEAVAADAATTTERSHALAATFSLCNQYWEGGTCTFSGTREVRFGTTTQYVTRAFTGSAYCHVSTFGDPAYGQPKQCWVSSETVSQGPSWTLCTQYWEGATCTFSGTRQVKYGTDTQYVIKTFTNSAYCHNSVFGDPAPGQPKKCWYSSTTPPPTPTKITVYKVPNGVIPNARANGQPTTIRIRIYGMPFSQAPYSKLVASLHTNDGQMTALGYADNHLMAVPSNTWSGYKEYDYTFYLPKIENLTQTTTYKMSVFMYGWGPNFTEALRYMNNSVACGSTSDRIPAASNASGEDQCVIGTISIAPSSLPWTPAPTAGNFVIINGTPYTP